jgi:DNA modification methylase
MSFPKCYRCGCQPCECKDGITLYHADCREVLPLLDPVDLVLTDPPYGIGFDKRETWGSSNKGVAKKYGKQEWDASTPDDWMMTAVRTAGRQAIIWGGNYFSLPPQRGWLVWDKDRTGDFADCELAWSNLETAVRKFRYRWNGMIQEHAGNKKEDRYHPTQKPLALMKWCLGFAPKAETVLDPFSGSGTTGRACKDLGRKCIMIEQEERYCEIAAKRLEQEVLFT